jgi:hypothetical protein
VRERPPLEVADLIREHGAEFRRTHGRSPAQDRVLSALVQCRTSALGGHVEECNRCGERQVAYNSCRNRHCPKCQGREAAEWVEAQGEHLLPVPYVHVVFTLPQILAPLALQNPRVVYNLLFQAVSRTLLDVAAEERHLGARIGFLAILHTWGQRLNHHPHLHCVVPAGGLSVDGSRWIHCRPTFFLPVRVLSQLFRGKVLAQLQKAHDDGRLCLRGNLRPLVEPQAFRRMLIQARAKEWVVYAKPPFGGPDQVLKYLARYTHRIAISNRRLVSLEQGVVTFRYKDYARGGQSRTLRLEAHEFLRRFLVHVLPKGFVRIRRYGLLANAQRRKNLARCLELLEAGEPQEPAPVPTSADSSEAEMCETPSGPYPCPSCQEGQMERIRILAPLHEARPPPTFVG